MVPPPYSRPHDGGMMAEVFASGLTSGDARNRQQLYGANTVDPPRQMGALRLLIRQFESPIVLILVVAACISLVTQQWTDAVIVLLIVLGSALLSFTQEYRASAAIEGLKRRLALATTAVRDGAEVLVPVSEIVPGDVVVLSAGSLVPADGRVLAAQDFLVSESSITGESFPVEKRPVSGSEAGTSSEHKDTVWLGSSVRSGTARVLVTATGRQTAFGAIAAEIAAREPEGDFARGVRHFGYLLIRVMFLVVLFVLMANLLLARPVVDSLLFAAALAVGLSPELLPAIVSVTLSAGARRMAAQGVIVRRLEAIENLGAMTVLCTDKTGTLTEGNMTLCGAVDPAGRQSPDVLRLAWLNASLETGIANPLDAALKAAGDAQGLVLTNINKVDEIPYDFERRRLTIVLSEHAAQLLVTKGAVEEVLSICTSVMTPDGEEPLADQRAFIEERFRTYSARGLRVLAVATRMVPVPKADYNRSDEIEMTFRGLLLFEDPPKAEAAGTIIALRELGISTKVISGDNRHVTAHVAGAVGLDDTSLLTGAEIAAMPDEALWHLAPRTSLFAEIDPQQKERIVRALQRTGEAVGYLGDGINDAPALHAADVGISVNEAVDVARESADIVLTTRDLEVLRLGVEGGRRTFANTLKYVSITTSANFGNMLSMAIVTPFLPFMPLAAKQILLNNFLSDLPLLAIATDRPDPDLLRAPQRWDVGEIRRFMIVFGLISSLFDLVTFVLLIGVLHAGEAQFQTTWFVISLMTEVAVVLVLRTRHAALRSRPTAILLWLSVCVMVLTLLIPWSGPLAEAFNFVPLPAQSLLVVGGVLAGYVVATERLKGWFFSRERGSLAGGMPRSRPFRWRR